MEQAGIRSSSYSKRLININWIKERSEEVYRDGFEYGSHERQIFFPLNNPQTELFIQFPGKESTRADDKAKPWDFRPKLEMEHDLINDLSFKDVWDTLFDSFEHAGCSCNGLKALAALFYRAAFMLDHNRHESINARIRDIFVNPNGSSEVLLDTEKEIDGPIYLYSPQQDLLSVTQNDITKFGQMDSEAFLKYNELLAWNEDGKYFYRDVVMGEKRWIDRIGRVSTLLTHVSVIGLIQGTVRFSDVMMGFVRSRGVSPATGDMVKVICGEFLET